MERWPIIDILIARDGDAYRIYAAPESWRVPALYRRADQRGDLYPAKRPDFDDLHRFMWACDAPYEVRRTLDGGAEIRVAGRAAICLWQWLEDLVGGLRA